MKTVNIDIYSLISHMRYAAVKYLEEAEKARCYDLTAATELYTKRANECHAIAEAFKSMEAITTDNYCESLVITFMDNES